MRTVGRLFGTPVRVDGLTWLPLAPLVVWIVMAMLAGRKQPHRSLKQRVAIGGLAMPLVLGAEWGHNLAHMAAGQLIGKPIEEMRIYGGMPRLLCSVESDRKVLPQYHIIRSLGGPLFNGSAVILLSMVRRWLKPETLAAELAEIALRVHTFIATVAFLPIPGIDGGPLLKWSLVLAGKEEAQADQLMRRLNWLLGGGLEAGMLAYLRMRRWFAAFICGMLGVGALGIASGVLKER